MKTKIQKLIDKMENIQYKVVRVTKEEFELEGGDIYPHTFELDEDITVEEFQKLLDSSKQLVLEQIKRINEEE
jgi:hypothetical protein